MSRSNKARRSRAGSPQHDEESDYQIALRLSEELNGGTLPLSSASKPGPDPVYDADADFAYALEMQFNDANGPYAGAGQASASHSGPTLRGGASRSENPPWAQKENEDEAKITNYHAETPGGKTFNTLTDFIEHVRSFKCSTCGDHFSLAKNDVITMLHAWKTGKKALTCSLKCSMCSRVTCIACTPQAYVPQSTISVQGKPISWCCSGGRLFLLWLLLCDLDEQFSIKTKKEAADRRERRPQPKRDNTKKSNQRARGGGIGFGDSSRPPLVESMPSGVGFGSDFDDFDDYADYSPNAWMGPGHTLSGHRFDANASNTDGKVKAFSAQRKEDQSNALLLELVEGLLPSFDRDSGFDFDPPDAVADMLIHSEILHYCAELLRNDSLQDATNRNDVYQALINFLRTLGAHYATASRAIYDERPSRQDKVYLADLLLFGFRQGSESKDNTPSLFSCLSNLSTQSELVLQGAKQNEKEFRTHDGQSLLLLCRQISELQEYLSANARTVGDAKPKESEPEIPALTELPDNVIFATHKFGPSAKSLSTAPSGRFKRLITEITTLKTGLPPGIFVRYADSRPDVQKVLIIGPSGTPYENGLFEFDVFCDANFPNRPPLVQFKTTGGGTVGFNPNLYVDGKVCLSLLGTWQGEPWVPSESTLLQIVISIQAMILCEGMFLCV